MQSNHMTIHNKTQYNVTMLCHCYVNEQALSANNFNRPIVLIYFELQSVSINFALGQTLQI